MRLYLTRAALGLVLILVGCSGMRSLQEQIPGQTPHRLHRFLARDIQYFLYLPEGYSQSRNQRYPLMLFLHGAGERGDTLDLVKKHGPPKLAAAGMAFPFIIVSPQCRKDATWKAKPLKKLLDTVIKRYRVDKTRIYLTGLSMGGFGTWSLAATYPEYFAAIAPICGAGDTRTVNQLIGIPVWAFHGAKDPVVPLKRQQDMVDALRRAGGDVRFTIYPSAEHDSWTVTYDNPELYTWLLSHRKTAHGN
ncbi:MAG: prolyl oligopeptidase family serine peptidase [Calditrichota bacterium]